MSVCILSQTSLGWPEACSVNKGFVNAWQAVDCSTSEVHFIGTNAKTLVWRKDHTLNLFYAKFYEMPLSQLQS